MNRKKRKDIAKQTLARQRRCRVGFTLVELLVVTVLGSFVALVAVSSLQTVAQGRDRMDDYSQAASELRYVSQLLRRDLQNLYRSAQTEQTRFAGELLEGRAGPSSYLTFYGLQRGQARPQGRESDLYEVEYFLMQEQEADKQIMFRRLWPHPDRQLEPGGVLFPLAETITGFAVRYFDSIEWQLEWPDERRRLPQLVEVTLIAQLPGREKTLHDSFLMSFARWPQQNQGSGRQAQGNRETPSSR